MRTYLAVDIGASSGRHILGRVQNGRIEIEEVYRFENQMVEKNGHKCWDWQALYADILAGMRACKAAGKVPDAMGIDTWAIDFALLDAKGHVVGDTVAYRDKRTAGMIEAVEAIVPFAELYGITGIQKMPINTIYHLMALKRQNPEQLEKAGHLLMIPDFFNHLLTGVQKQEYTNATTTALVNAEAKTWDMALIERLGLPARLFGPLTMPGATVGPLTPEVEKQVGFNCTVLLPATHDTGSAYMAVPARDDDAAYLSSGTWSLLGCESTVPIISETGLRANITNEGGYDTRFRVLKNIMGLWMIQSIRREYDKKYSFMELEDLARQNEDYTGVVDVNDDAFLAPESMEAAIKTWCAGHGQPVPGSLGQLMQCVYRGLAACYKKSIEGLSALTGKTFTSLNIVGGGCKDGYLNQLTANATGLTVYAGPSEGTVIGNLMAQMLASGEFTDLAAARKAVKESFSIKKFEPKG